MSKNTADQVAYKKQLEADEKKLDSEIASITAKIKAEEASGVTPSNRYDGGTFKWPTTSTRITSPYGDTSDRTSPHKGVDIGAVRAGAVSYTHLDVYKRQTLTSSVVFLIFSSIG